MQCVFDEKEGELIVISAVLVRFYVTSSRPPGCVGTLVVMLEPIGTQATAFVVPLR
jgi:hypothetical protein